MYSLLCLEVAFMDISYKKLWKLLVDKDNEEKRPANVNRDKLGFA